MADRMRADLSLFRQEKSRRLVRDLKRARYLYLLLLFPIAWYIVFCYTPMYWILISFKDYSLFGGMAKSPWVGFKHFVKFLNDQRFWHVFGNTVKLGSLNLLFNFPVPILLALLFNEMRMGIFKRVTQTISYLPHFVSTVAVVSIALTMLSPSTGIVNAMIRKLGGAPISFFTEKGWFRPIYIVLMMWKETGWGCIIYLAAMAGINSELYDAADIDGAGRLRKIWSVTLPSILPTIVIILMIAVPGLLVSDFETVLLIQTPVTYDTADVMGTYIYRTGLIDGRFDYAAAIGLFFAILSMCLIYTSNRLGRKFGGISIW
jgi:putative aldouronate transport system permease protein